MTAEFLKTQFDDAFDYERYLGTGNDEQRRRWQQVLATTRVTDGQRRLIQSFSRDLHLLVISGIWCGDCVQQCPLIHAIAAENPDRLRLRFVDRDANRALSGEFKINGGDRVPVVLFLAEDFHLCGTYGERSLSRYRAIARRQLGPSCETGLAVPDQDEIAATVQDWLNEIERIQLMLRLSPRLRQIHND